MRPSNFFRRLSSAYTKFCKLMNLEEWKANLSKGHSVKLNVEAFEERIVPYTSSILYNFSDSGGEVTSGLNITVTEGQAAVFIGDVARTLDSITADPASPTPTGTVTFTLTDETTSDVYTIGVVSLTEASTGVGEAELITTMLPIATDVFELGMSYSGDSTYSSSSASDIAEITMQSPPAGAPATLAPSGLGGPSPVQVPTGDGVAADVGVSEAGVAYGTGSIDVSRTDLSSFGFGTNCGESFDWTNATGYSDGLGDSHGYSVQTQAPHLVQINSNSGIAVVTNGANADFFDYYLGSYHARFGLDATLTHDTDDNEFILSINGDTFTFNDFSDGDTTAAAGTLLSVADAYGDLTTVECWNSAGAPLVVEQTNGSGGSEVYQKFVSTYISSGTNEGLLESVTQETKVGSGSWTTVEVANYSYYTSGDSHGYPGELETALVTDASDNLMSAAYYREYTTTGLGGDDPAGLITYTFGTAGYEGLVAAYDTTDLDSLSNADVAPYADAAYEYGSNGQVSHVAIAGDGSGSVAFTSGQDFVYSYTSNTTSNTGLLDPNVWTTKTVEQLPGIVGFFGTNENIVYTNAFGQEILSIYKDYSTGYEWMTDYR